MAATEQKINDNTDPLKDILNILGQFGTGTTTSKSSTEPGAAASSQADALMQSIQQSVNPDNLAELVKGILLKAKTALGPNIAASIGAGNRTISDSSLAQLQSEAAARATAESAQAILEAENNAAKLTTSIVNTKLNASRTTTQTQRTGVSPAGKALVGLGLAQKAKKLLTFEKTPSKDIQPEQLGYSQEQLANLSGPEQLSGPGFDASASVTDVIPSADTSSSLSLSEGGGDVLFGAALGEADKLTNAAGDEFAIPTLSGGDQTMLPGGSLSGSPGGSGDVGGSPTIGPNDPGGGLPSDSGGGSQCFLCWIVCTELHRQGKLPTRWYIPGSRVFAKYDDNIKRGYYFWAIPLSKHLRYFPDSLLSKITTIGCNHRAEFIAHRAGIRGARKTLRGWIVIHSLYWACWFLGKMLPKKVLLTTEQIHGRINS